MSSAIDTTAAQVESGTIVPTIPTIPMETIKVNGKEIKVSIDEMKRAYGLHKAAEEKFQNAAKMRKEAEDIKQKFSKKDISVLKDAGLSEDEIESMAADYLVKLAQQKTMTPQQRAQYEREKEYEALKKEKETREQTEKTKAQQELQAREAKIIQTQFIKDVQKANEKTWLDLDDPVILGNIINEITTAINKYEYNMSVDEAVKRLEDRLEKRGPAKKEFLRKLLKSNIKDIDDNDLEAFLQNGGKGVREKSVEMFKKAESPLAKLKPQTQSTPVEDTSIKKDHKYYRDLRLKRK